MVSEHEDRPLCVRAYKYASVSLSGGVESVGWVIPAPGTSVLVLG